MARSGGQQPGIHMGLQLCRHRRHSCRPGHGLEEESNTLSILSLTALYASPLVALAPLFIIVFGVGVLGKAALVFLLAVFPFVFNAFAGVKSTDALLINVIRSYGGHRERSLLKVILPSTMPYIIAGARLAIGRGLVGLSSASSMPRPKVLVSPSRRRATLTGYRTCSSASSSCL